MPHPSTSIDGEGAYITRRGKSHNALHPGRIRPEVGHGRLPGAEVLSADRSRSWDDCRSFRATPVPGLRINGFALGD